jgi:hypothetical protein
MPSTEHTDQDINYSHQEYVEEDEYYEPMEPEVVYVPREPAIIDLTRKNRLQVPRPVNMPSLKKQQSMGMNTGASLKLHTLPRWTLSVGNKIVLKDSNPIVEPTQSQPDVIPVPKKTWVIVKDDGLNWTTVSKKKGRKVKASGVDSHIDFPKLGEKNKIPSKKPKIYRHSKVIEVSRTRTVPRGESVIKKHCNQIEIRVPKHLYERASAYLASVKTTKSIKIIAI